MSRVDNKRRGIWKRLRNWWFFLAVCVVAAVLIRIFVVATYTVPTESMEPLFHGHKENGDRVAVFKPYYALFEPERFDLVVFRGENKQEGRSLSFVEGEGDTVILVKRIVGFSGERIRIGDDGDLFLGEEGNQRIRKSIPLIQSMLIPVYRARFDEAFFERWRSFGRIDGVLKEDPEARADCWKVENGILICDAASPRFGNRRIGLTYGAEIQDGFLNGDGLTVPGLSSVKDVSITLECEIAGSGTGGIFGDLSADGDLFGFELYSTERGGGCINHGYGTPAVREISPDRFPGLEPGRRYTIQFLNVDDQVGLLCNGTVLAHYEYEGEKLDPWYNIPWFGAFGLEVSFHDIRIDRDIHYTQTGTKGVSKPYTVSSNHCFFLGDNSRKSGDSRIFGGVAADRIMGRPFMIFYPFSRFRFL